MKQSIEHTGLKQAKTTSSGGNVTTGRQFFQPKLTVNQPDDVYEQEADAVAERVMRMASPEADSPPFFAPRPVVIQRKCKECEEEEEHVHRKESNGGMPAADSDFEQYVMGLPGRGVPLSTAERQYFEPRFQRDLSDVRIHTGYDAAQSAQRIHALAYTVGRDIVFNTGQYQPHSQRGKRLIAHELVHTIQQGAIGDSQSPGTTPVVQRQDDAESDVDVLAEASIELLDQVLPVGVGFSYEIEGGVTWGYPVYTGGSVIVYVTRQSEERVHLRVRKQGRLAFDTGVGGSVMIGTPSRRGGGGSGSRGYGIGAEAGANAMAGVQGAFIEEYSIPAGEVLRFVGAQLLETAVSASILGAPLTQLLEGHASEYLIQQRIEGGVFANADAEVSAGIRRPTDSFGGSGAVGAGGSAWGPNDDRNFQGTRPDILRGDPLAILNFLSVFAGSNVNAGLTFGYDQRTNGDTTTTSLFIEGQFGLMLGLPIPVINDALASLPPNAGGGVELRIVQRPDGEQQVFAVVYIKQGEDQYYAGSAGQQEMVVNLTNILSWEEVFDALISGELPDVSSLGSLPDLLERVSFFQRLSLQSPNLAGFAALLRRQRGARSLLATNTLSRARRVYGAELNAYLDFGADIAGPDFLTIARQLLEASRGAVDSLDSATDLSSAYEALSGYFSGYVQSEAFEALSEQILGTTVVNTAKLRLEIGIGIGVSARLAEGAKARFDVSGQVGMSCELDIIQVMGGPVSLANLVPRVIEVLDNPTQHLPDCPIIRALYNEAGGLGGSGDSGHTGGEAASGAATPSDASRGGSAPRHAGSSSTSEHSTPARSTPPPDYELSHVYPTDAPLIEFPIHDVRNLTLDVAEGEERQITILVSVPPANTTTFWVPVQIRVVEVSDGRLVVAVTEPWWIASGPIGSNIGHEYTFQSR